MVEFAKCVPESSGQGRPSNSNTSSTTMVNFQIPSPDIFYLNGGSTAFILQTWVSSWNNYTLATKISITSVDSCSSPSSSVPVSSSSVVALPDKIDSYLISAPGDFSCDDVIRMSPARVADFVSYVIEKHGLSIDFHQYMARFVY